MDLTDSVGVPMRLQLALRHTSGGLIDRSWYKLLFWIHHPDGRSQDSSANFVRRPALASAYVAGSARGPILQLYRGPTDVLRF
jgi:hypothetical protein